MHTLTFGFFFVLQPSRPVYIVCIYIRFSSGLRVHREFMRYIPLGFNPILDSTVTFPLFCVAALKAKAELERLAQQERSHVNLYYIFIYIYIESERANPGAHGFFHIRSLFLFFLQP